MQKPRFASSSPRLCGVELRARPLRPNAEPKPPASSPGLRPRSEAARFWVTPLANVPQAGGRGPSPLGAGGARERQGRVDLRPARPASARTASDHSRPKGRRARAHRRAPPPAEPRTRRARPNQVVGLDLSAATSAPCRAQSAWSSHLIGSAQKLLPRLTPSSSISREAAALLSLPLPRALCPPPRAWGPPLCLRTSPPLRGRLPGPRTCTIPSLRRDHREHPGQQATDGSSPHARCSGFG